MYLGLLIVLQVGSLFVDNVCEEHYKRAHQFLSEMALEGLCALSTWPSFVITIPDVTNYLNQSVKGVLHQVQMCLQRFWEYL